MGQYKFYITIGLRFIFGIKLSPGRCFEVYFLCFCLGIGLEHGASGFGIWKD